VIENGSMLANKTSPNGPPVEDRVVKHVRDLEAWYQAEFERRLAELTELLNAQLRDQILELRTHYENLNKSPSQSPVDTPQAATGAFTPEKILKEIKRNEAVANNCASELERMVGDDSVSLGLLLQMRNQQLELKAYLRGLKFCADSAPAPAPSPKAE
jgi:hypothetical protein